MGILLPRDRLERESTLNTIPGSVPVIALLGKLFDTVVDAFDSGLEDGGVDGIPLVPLVFPVGEFVANAPDALTHSLIVLFGELVESVECVVVDLVHGVALPAQ